MNTLTPLSPVETPIDISQLPWTEQELVAIRELCADTELSGFALLRQALRLYQTRHRHVQSGTSSSIFSDGFNTPRKFQLSDMAPA